MKAEAAMPNDQGKVLASISKPPVQPVGQPVGTHWVITESKELNRRSDLNTKKIF